MGIHRIKSFLYIILLAWGLPAECTCCLTEQYFNENILSYPFSFFDASASVLQPVLYRYKINTESCDPNLSIEVEYKIFSPEIGISSYETFYIGNIILNDAIPLKYFTNNEIQSICTQEFIHTKNEKYKNWYELKFAPKKSGMLNFGIRLFPKSEFLFRIFITSVIFGMFRRNIVKIQQFGNPALIDF
jgi:hypothetical protein